MPIASFLAGSLLSILLPTIMLTVLVVWYLKFIRRVPDTDETREPPASATAPGAAPSAAPGGSPPDH